MKTTFYRISAEFYINGEVKACMTTKRAEQMPSFQNKHTPIMQAFVFWFSGAALAKGLYARIKSGDIALDSVNGLYTDMICNQRAVA